MANFPVDPRPHMPKGFSLVEAPLRPPLGHEVSVIGCYSLYNKDLAIVRLEPKVHKDDFGPLATELRKFFSEIHQARVSEIQPCPFGEAFVRFGSPLEREHFLGPVFAFGSYQMTVIKHDEAENARVFYLDREAWVMLVGFPEDLRNPMVITKSVSTFGILVYWHNSENLTRVVVKVYLNDEGKIPDSVKVNAGAPYKGRSWTVPVFVLKKNGVTVVPDEEVYVIEGPFHPMPFQPPRWTGPTNPARSNATPVDSQADNLMDIEADGNRAPTVGRQGNQVVAAFEPVDENVVLQEMLFWSCPARPCCC
ncbi:uncharacterized protein [Miscanthus floridulus]|uniref:uncharacterized protein n=1 Tax=Miscanthus floridulus TaxID=154761 RepID=UPI00345A3134